MIKKIVITLIILTALISTALTGCLEGTNSLTIGEIGKHPNKYINSEVTVNGLVESVSSDFWNEKIYTITDNFGNSILAEISENVDDSFLQQNREYPVSYTHLTLPTN